MSPVLHPPCILPCIPSSSPYTHTTAKQLLSILKRRVIPISTSVVKCHPIQLLSLWFPCHSSAAEISVKVCHVYFIRFHLLSSFLPLHFFHYAALLTSHITSFTTLHPTKYHHKIPIEFQVYLLQSLLCRSLL